MYGPQFIRNLSIAYRNSLKAPDSLGAEQHFHELLPSLCRPTHMCGGGRLTPSIVPADPSKQSSLLATALHLVTRCGAPPAASRVIEAY